MEIKTREHLDKIDDIKGVQMKIEWGSQIRSYVFMPYTLVKDHRTGFENGNVGAVMAASASAAGGARSAAPSAWRSAPICAPPRRCSGNRRRRRLSRGRGAVRSAKRGGVPGGEDPRPRNAPARMCGNAGLTSWR